MSIFKGMFLSHDDVSDTLTKYLPILRAEFRTETNTTGNSMDISSKQEDWFEAIMKR